MTNNTNNEINTEHEAERRPTKPQVLRGRKLTHARAQRGGDILNPLRKLQRNRKSRALAIRAMCWDCQGGEGADPGWKWAIGNCEIKQCPLWGFRPYQHKQGQPPEGVYRD